MNQVEDKTDKNTKTDTSAHHIPRYKVILHNDDKTTMNFITWLLSNVFNHTAIESEKIMMEVHEKGAGIAGVYPLELAEMRQDMSLRLAKANDFPLKVSIESD